MLSENAKFCGVYGKKVEEKIVQPQMKIKQEAKRKTNQEIKKMVENR